ncbi:Sua5/YciO/YrdC/YwlC family protein [Glaciecola sp. MH2013]|uniref:Sua5/YciO/YrdC/YwlC family protein n=1 Tax=Glaciecola sp. MH2013 TaxID=2785524 RepID=UPI0018A0EC83|nr:Sua5/YciO/YrdC/YwlC family protein [Glaciecola sp. MH2013]MBF7074680.1 Sua5/YciO/YrdC/YwlC family protein [Glaciecola sp. MH2013]
MQLFIDAFHHQQCFSYPTEAVFGLGCDPLSEKAMMDILSLKSRPVEKGVILIAGSVEQLDSFIELDKIAEANQEKIFASWPGPFTWLLPKSAKTPSWVSGNSDLVAVRVTNHPLVKEMCAAVNSPMVSTSANPAGKEPARTEQQVVDYFGSELLVVEGALGEQQQPSTIINGLTLETLRS